ncbi:MAG: DNA topoisomerase VI subunit B [Thermoplasmata archaeon]|nr:DNA topoisomerase VI subunit B [Candidatus Sysuiplasma acidicola]MBX8646523.1 DNA topoisomerase VI subunit B [Candidatus Sysuiplasma acidicola]MDH2905195.1 DNA topoisomerase VI subunit B [Methanomassiliicoccales archaeon]
MATIAEEMARKQKEISVSEFFERNRQILGFDSTVKALIVAVKEAVDNSLDACEEAMILPELDVSISKISQNEYRVVVRDNGPGVVRTQIPNVFGRLLYGSRFHAIRQSRGQQGIGISAVVMYSQITTGQATHIWSKVAESDVTNDILLTIDTKKNKPVVLKEDHIMWEEGGSRVEHGTKLEFSMVGRYVTGKQSVLEYLKSTAVVNPHATIRYTDPDGRTFVFERATQTMPPKAIEIKPHPYGLEIGTLINMLSYTEHKKLSIFLRDGFSRISDRVAREICERAMISQDKRPRDITLEQAKSLLNAISQTKIMAPQTDCLSPIGETLIKRGLKNVLGSLRPEFYAQPVTRQPAVYGGNPFQVEVGIVYGGELQPDQQVTIMRYANRVPLLYQQGACAITQSIESVDWRRYGLEQRGGSGIPFGPAIILVHVLSTKLPFTSESKEAIAAIPEIMQEIDLALKISARNLKSHLNKKETRNKAAIKFDIVTEIVPKIAEKTSAVLERPVPDISRTITKIMNVVYIEDGVDYEPKKKSAKGFVRIRNYTSRKQALKLHALVPAEHIVAGNITPSPTELTLDGKLTWEILKIQPLEVMEFRFELGGLDKDDYTENEIYISDINPAIVIGAEQLPGDWGIKTFEFETEEQETDPDAADYDEEGGELSEE